MIKSYGLCVKGWDHPITINHKTKTKDTYKDNDNKNDDNDYNDNANEKCKDKK